jgi:hypothetical protein
MATPTMGVFSALLLGGLMGLVGQGARAAIGLKKMNDTAQSTDLDWSDVFIASRFFVSLGTGFVVGVITALAKISDLVQVDADHMQVLIAIAAAGYAGTDAIEAFTAQLGGQSGTQPSSSAAIGNLSTTLTALNANVAGMLSMTPQGARALVYRVLKRRFPHATIDDTTTLAALGYTDGPSLAGLAVELENEGSAVAIGAIQQCTTVGDVVKAVANAGQAAPAAANA